MPTLTDADVLAIAALARLGLSQDEARRMTQDLDGVLEHFSAIGDIDTTDVPTADDVTGLTNVARDDDAPLDALCDTEALLMAMPHRSDRLLKSKAVFAD